MTTPQRFEEFRGWVTGPRRREAIRKYLAEHKGILARVAVRAQVDRSVVSKVLHGRAVSANVEQAFAAEENEYANVA